MANEAIGEERLKHIKYACESSNAKTLRDNVKELLFALREAQERYQELGLQYITAVGQAQESLARAEKAERSLVAALAELGLQNAPCDAGEMVINSVRALLSSVRLAQERAEKAEEAGYRRGIEAAIEAIKRSYNFTDPGRETERKAFLTSMEEVGFLLAYPPDTQTEETP